MEKHFHIQTQTFQIAFPISDLDQNGLKTVPIEIVHILAFMEGGGGGGG